MGILGGKSHFAASENKYFDWEMESRLITDIPSFKNIYFQKWSLWWPQYILLDFYGLFRLQHLTGVSVTARGLAQSFEFQME